MFEFISCLTVPNPDENLNGSFLTFQTKQFFHNLCTYALCNKAVCSSIVFALFPLTFTPIFDFHFQCHSALSGLTNRTGRIRLQQNPLKESGVLSLRLLQSMLFRLRLELLLEWRSWSCNSERNNNISRKTRHQVFCNLSFLMKTVQLIYYVLLIALHCQNI